MNEAILHFRSRLKLRINEVYMRYDDVDKKFKKKKDLIAFFIKMY